MRLGAAKVMAAGVNKDHLERLHSRVDQQSTLIEMLKQRADKTQHELTECEQRYGSALKQVSQLQEMLAKVSGEKALLEDRFHTLAKNHEEMIRIKDEYKRAVGRFSGEQKKETVMVEQLQDELKLAKSSRDEIGKKYEVLERRICELESKMEAEKVAHQLSIKELNSSHLEETSALKRSLERTEVTVKKVSEEHDKKTKQVAELMANLEHLRQSLSSSEADTQEHLSTVHSLEDKLAQMKSELEHTRRRHKEELSRDSHISRLRKELEKNQQKLALLEEEYSAFKTHSNHLLSHERELNNKLRHLLD